MKPAPARHIVQRILNRGDIRLNGDRPWDLKVHRPEFYRRLMLGGALALGESYMEGWWDCPALDRFIARLLRADLDRRSLPLARLHPKRLKVRLSSSHAKCRAFEVGHRHYDLGNTLFGAMLDHGMNYSCAYWKEAADLDAAQEAKLDLICRKLELKPGMRVLDIGCGWGGFALYAAQHFGVQVTGITVSEQQARLARRRAQGLPVKIESMDYRDLAGSFDRIVSIGMFEHVGRPRYRTYMRAVARCLKPGGLFLLHTIGGNISVRSVDPWFAKYIFPNSMLPSARQITAAAERLFVLEDWHSFGAHYDRTLMAWYANFKTAWPRIKAGIKASYAEYFFRMWSYYLLASAGAFRARKNQLWQIVFSKNGVPGGYSAPR